MKNRLWCKHGSASASERSCRDPPDTVTSDDGSSTSMTSNASAASPAPDEVLLHRFLRRSSPRLSFASPRRNNNLEEEKKNHSPVAKRFVIRRFSESQNVLVRKSCSSKRVMLMLLFGTLVAFLTAKSRERKKMFIRPLKSASYLRDRPIRWPKPKVVVLPGPHSTETTYTQMCMAKWTTNLPQPLLED
ncbi:hypothetical protein IV203_008716 [Nitzschia inconspicua]|uniref:Uncharacterized protein n=1 Tax=Nitzschia inconspicua TaxID=303405 RepID=A0A9K3L0K8_9STRA|nr:hypothetical protein IV203_008716 [Nitzschia inconspicua]